MRRGIEQAIIDEDDLARKMTALYRDPARRQSVAIAGRELASTMTWDRIGRRFTEIVGEMLA
jgi:hypothetical protein